MQRPDGEIVILAFTAEDVIILSKKSKEERKEYIQEYFVQLSRLGAIAKAGDISLDLDKMEEFNMETFYAGPSVLQKHKSALGETVLLDVISQ